jgi:hypothetical protein
MQNYSSEYVYYTLLRMGHSQAYSANSYECGYWPLGKMGHSHADGTTVLSNTKDGT